MPVRDHLSMLQCLGYWRSFPRVRATAHSLPIHLQYLREITKRILGFGICGYLTLHISLTEIHFRLDDSFGYVFLQIPHWLIPKLLLPSSGNFSRVSLDTLDFAYSFPPFRVETGLPVSCCPYRAHRLSPTFS